MLTGKKKQIPSLFFYDSTGSKLFESISALPEYYLTRTEIQLLKQAATVLQSKLHHIDIIEFGSGDCTKISILLEKIPEKNRETICYFPFDVSPSAVKQAATTLLTKFPGIHIHGIVADFMTQLNILTHEKPKLFCFLGSTIGNFSREKAQNFLTTLSSTMQSGDLLLIGFDMIKNITKLEQAYNDSKHITDQFNKNILSVVNSHIDTDFNLDLFEHVAFYNKEDSRIEMHLRATEDMHIDSPSFLEPLFLSEGETIHTENSYKFTQEHINQFAAAAHLDIQQLFTDEQKWFSLVLLQKP